MRKVLGDPSEATNSSFLNAKFIILNTKFITSEANNSVKQSKRAVKWTTNGVHIEHTKGASRGELEEI